MNELEGMINGLMSNPDEMKKIMEMANSIMSGAGNTPSEEPPSSPPTSTPAQMPDLSGLGNLLGGLSSLPPGISAAAQKLIQNPAKTSGDKSALFTSLTPFLSEKRRSKLERAVQLAKMMNIGLSIFGKNGG